MANSITLAKCTDFSVRIVNLYKYLTQVKHEYVLSKQLLRCGTSIGANFTEALHGISTSDFLAKIYISLKECAETKYWLEILYRTDFLTREQYNSINDDCIELIKLLTAITKTTNKNKSKNVAR